MQSSDFVYSFGSLSFLSINATDLKSPHNCHAMITLNNSLRLTAVTRECDCVDIIAVNIVLVGIVKTHASRDGDGNALPYGEGMGIRNLFFSLK